MCKKRNFKNRTFVEIVCSGIGHVGLLAVS